MFAWSWFNPQNGRLSGSGTGIEITPVSVEASTNIGSVTNVILIPYRIRWLIGISYGISKGPLHAEVLYSMHTVEAFRYALKGWRLVLTNSALPVSMYVVKNS